MVPIPGSADRADGAADQGTPVSCGGNAVAPGRRQLGWGRRQGTADLWSASRGSAKPAPMMLRHANVIS